MSTHDPSQGVAAVDRAMRILAAFDNKSKTLELAELAERSGLYKSTILRILNSLIEAQMILREADGSYSLDHECGRLGAVYRMTRDPEAVLRKILSNLAETTCLTAGYFVIQGEYRVCLSVEMPRTDVFHHLNEGDRLLLRQGAAGRLLCAHNGIELEESAQARRDGYLFRHGDRYQELSSLAVPVFDHNQVCQGVISLSGRTSLFTEKTIIELASFMRRGAASIQGQVFGPHLR